MLALYRAWRVAREDASGIALTSGRRMLLPNEEVRDVFDDHANYFPELEAAAEAIAAELPAALSERNHAIAERLRQRHGISVAVRPLEAALRAYDAEARSLTLSESLPRESRGFHMAFQLALLEARGAVEAVLETVKPSTPEAARLLAHGLLNYAAGALLMPYQPYLEAARTLRHDMEAVAARFGVSFEQACQRLSSLQRPGARGVPFFFLRVDPAGNVSKRFSAAGFPFARYGGSCPRWVVHGAFATPGVMRVQVATCRTGRRSCASPARSPARLRAGAIRRRCMWWRWAARSRWRAIWFMPTGWTCNGLQSASAFPAACATARTAAAALFPRWSTVWRSTRCERGSARSRSRHADEEVGGSGGDPGHVRNSVRFPAAKGRLGPCARPDRRSRCCWRCHDRLGMAAQRRTSDRSRAGAGERRAARRGRSHPREDIVQVFSDVPHAGRSGFEVRRSAVSGRGSWHIEVIGRRDGWDLIAFEQYWLADAGAPAAAPDPHLMQRVSDNRDISRFRQVGYNIAAQLLRALMEHLGADKSPRLLDWGCGSGRDTVHRKLRSVNRRAFRPLARYPPDRVRYR